MIIRIEHKSLPGYYEPQFFHGPFHAHDNLPMTGVQLYRERGDFDPCSLPNPWNDNMHNHNDKFIFGFKDFNQLKEWFPEESGRWAMYQKGFRVYHYNAKKIVRGEYQISFVPTGVRQERVHLALLTRY